MNIKYLLLITLILSLPVQTQAEIEPTSAVTHLIKSKQDNSDATFESYLQKIQDGWATVHYHTADNKKSVEFEALSKLAENFARQFPDRAEPLIWEGIILSTWAGVEGGFGALSKVKQARSLFETALSIDSLALDGSAYTSLGSLYYQVPGWPISFGSDKKAKQLLEKALSISPDGIDANYFYADFLIQSEGDYNHAKIYLEKAQHASPRPNRSLEDEGRHEQIRKKINLVLKNIN